jgi:NADH-quinone oxidoreductase subunit E
MNSSKHATDSQSAAPTTQPAAPMLDVLIIDDEGLFIQACRETLENNGYRTAATSEKQGIQTILSDQPDVVIIDLKPPEQTGLETLRLLSQKAPSVVPIVVTGEATVDAAVESMKLGAFDFLTKPCTPEKLLETVRRASSLSALRKEVKTPDGQASTHPSAKQAGRQDLLLQGLDVLGVAYSMGLGKRQLLEELAHLENEARYHAASLGQVKKKEQAILDIRNELMEADEIMRNYDFQKNSLIQVLLDIQEKFRWLPRHILNWISGRLNIPLRDIYVVANFYEAFSLEPRGRHIIQVCTGTACHVRGASELLTRISASLGIKPGETDKRQAFTLETVHCIGCCALAPVVQIDSRYHRDPSQRTFEKIIKSLEKEEAEA